MLLQNRYIESHIAVFVKVRVITAKYQLEIEILSNYRLRFQKFLNFSFQLSRSKVSLKNGHAEVKQLERLGLHRQKRSTIKYGVAI